MKIGLYIKDMLKRRGVRSAELARLIGISKSHLCEIEKLKTPPSVKVIRDISKVMNDKNLMHFYLSSKYPEIEKDYIRKIV